MQTLFLLLFAACWCHSNADIPSLEAKIKTIRDLVCNQTLTDDVCANIKANCLALEIETLDKTYMKCRKTKTLTDRERVLSYCDNNIRGCIKQEAVDKIGQDKAKLQEAEDKAALLIECLKKEIPKPKSGR